MTAAMLLAAAVPAGGRHGSSHATSCCGHQLLPTAASAEGTAAAY
jgi:hypothetical protein